MQQKFFLDTKIVVNSSSGDKPFQSNAADEVDGAAEEDVVQREDKLGEEEGVDVTALAEGPGEH